MQPVRPVACRSMHVCNVHVNWVILQNVVKKQHYCFGLYGDDLLFCRYNYESEDYDGRHKSFRNSEGGFCQPYHGAACSGYIGNEIVYVTERFRPSQVEQSLSGRTVTPPSSQLSNDSQ